MAMKPELNFLNNLTEILRWSIKIDLDSCKYLPACVETLL